MNRKQLGNRPTEPLSTKIVKTVAELKDTEPTELEQPLYEAINPDALDQLFTVRPGRNVRGSGEIQFMYCGCSIIITPDGDVNAIPKEE